MTLGRRVAGGLLAVVIIVFAMVVVSDHPRTADDGMVTTESPAQVVAPSSPPSPTVTAAPTPTVTAKPSPSKSTPPPPVIKQAEPTRIAISGTGYKASVGLMATDANGDVNPPTLQDTYRITNRGVAPGTKAGNTVYMACHSYSKGFAPCNLVFQKAKPGQHVLVTTRYGTLDYLIQTTKLYSKDGEFKNSPEVRAVVPGRLVLVTCFQHDGKISTQNFVVFAQLVAGR